MTKYKDEKTDEIGSLKELRPSVTPSQERLSADECLSLGVYRVVDRLKFDRSSEELVNLVEHVVDEKQRTCLTVGVAPLEKSVVLDAARRDKLRELKSRSVSHEQGGLWQVPNGGGTLARFQTDPISQARFIGIHSMMVGGEEDPHLGGVTSDVDEDGEHNAVFPVTDNQMKGLCREVFAFVRDTHKNKIKLEKQIVKATTVAALKKIDLSVGWPDNFEPS